MTLELETADAKTTTCDCCGATTHTVWGFVHEQGGGARCAYFVNWAEGRSKHPPHIALGYGAWGDGTTAADRRSIYAELHRGGWQFVDNGAPGEPPGQVQVFGAPLRARDVEQDPRGGEVKETLDFIVRADDRLPF
jgi:hypothetical protein